MNLITSRWRRSIVRRIQQKRAAINVMINTGCTVGEMLIQWRSIEKLLEKLLKHLERKWKIK